MLKNALMLLATAAIGYFLYDMHLGGTVRLPDWVPAFSFNDEEPAAHDLRDELRALYSQVCAPLDEGASVSDEEIHGWLNTCETGYLDGTYSRETATAGWQLCRNLLRLNAERRTHLKEKERLSSTSPRVLNRPNIQGKLENDSAQFIRQTDLSWDKYVDQFRSRCERYLDAID